MPRDYQVDHASRNLMAFVRLYIELLEKNLEAVRSTMRETVEGVMSGIQEISSRTEEKKRKASEVLLSTYTQPDSETKASMDAVQNEVERIFESARSGESEKYVPPALGTNGNNDVIASAMRRSAGLFSKHAEALGTLDSDLQELLMSMMGMLSRDDVISQRIDHVVAALHALQAGLSYILVDYQNRCKDGDVDRLIQDVKKFTVGTYTMEDEKRVFYEIFPDIKRAS